jgi:hypothetical protein
LPAFLPVPSSLNLVMPHVKTNFNVCAVRPLGKILNDSNVNPNFSFKCTLTFTGDEPPGCLRKSDVSAMWVVTVSATPTMMLSSIPRSIMDAEFRCWVVSTAISLVSAMFAQCRDTQENRHNLHVAVYDTNKPPTSNICLASMLYNDHDYQDDTNPN